MATPVAGCNPVDGRGRGEPTRGKSLQLGTHKRLWLNSPRTGKNIKFNKKHNHLTVSFFLYTFSMLVLPTMTENPHKPFKWSLIRWSDQKEIQSKTMVGPPSFMVGLCNLTDIEHCGKVLNQTAFYMCPSSNPGKSYYNYPGEYFCAYWGCETVASD